MAEMCQLPTHAVQHLFKRKSITSSEAGRWMSSDGRMSLIHKLAPPSQSISALFNYLVGEVQQGLLDFEANRLGRSQVNHQLKFHRALNREVGGCGALQ